MAPAQRAGPPEAKKNDQNVKKPLAKQAYRARNEVILEANEDYLGGRGRARRGGRLGAPENDLNAEETLGKQAFRAQQGSHFGPHEDYLGGRGGAPEPELGILFLLLFYFSAGQKNKSHI